MAHVRQRWLGIVTRVVGKYLAEPELLAYGTVLDRGEQDGETHPATADGIAGERLEIVVVNPSSPSPQVLAAIRRDLTASDLPIEVDIRQMADLTIAEQDDALQRGIRFGS